MQLLITIPWISFIKLAVEFGALLGSQRVHQKPAYGLAVNRNQLPPGQYISDGRCLEVSRSGEANSHYLLGGVLPGFQ